jgi:hypothetical protein
MLLISPNHNDPAGNDNRDRLGQEKKRQEQDLFLTPLQIRGYRKRALTKAFLFKKKRKQKDKLHLVVL